MFSNLIFSSIPGFSRLFLDFISGSAFFDSRFPFNKALFNDKSAVLKRNSSNEKRIDSKKLLLSSMNSIELTLKQKNNLELFTEQNTFTVMTGQQVGFLGGPLYTFYKTATVIALSEKLKSIYPDLNFIPVFWVEDNDHDNFEASHIQIFDKSYGIKSFSCESELKKDDRTPVSELIFSESIHEIIANIETELPETEYKHGLTEFLESIYKSGESWGDAFILFLNKYFAEKGLLFIKASTARKSGLWKELIQKEFSVFGKTNLIINQANSLIESNGYHIQAKSSEINLFHHNIDKRYKIESSTGSNLVKIHDEEFTYDDLKVMATETPWKFSPNVLLRPVFQDYLFPNLAYIGGPSEIGYCSQIAELYDYFGVAVPAFLMRHSATILPQKISKIIENEEIQITDLMRRFADIENELSKKINNLQADSVFDKAKEDLSLIFEELEIVAVGFDKTLSGTAKGAMEKSIQQIDNLEKKVHAAQKRNNSIIFDRFRHANNLVFPENALQERIFSPVNIINLFGEEKFKEILDELSKNENSVHWIIKHS